MDQALQNTILDITKNVPEQVVNTLTGVNTEEHLNVQYGIPAYFDVWPAFYQYWYLTFTWVSWYFTAFWQGAVTSASSVTVVGPIFLSYIFAISWPTIRYGW